MSSNGKTESSDPQARPKKKPRFERGEKTLERLTLFYSENSMNTIFV
jgi:hypothetical protein